MPHVIVKMYKGRTDEQKQKLSEALAQTLRDVLGSEDRTISIAIEDFEKEAWPETVYKPDILNKSSTIFKKPGYNPFG